MSDTHLDREHTRGWVNIRSLGADDELSDNSDALQRAFDAPEDVVIPGGAYSFSTPLSLAIAKHIRASRGRVLLRFTGNTAGGAAQIGFQAGQLDGVALSGVRIEKAPGATAQRLLHLQGVERSRFQHVRLGGDAAGTGATGDNLLLERSWINTFNGLYSRFAGGYGANLKAQTAFNVDASNDNQFFGCDFEDNALAGASVVDSVHNVFYGCSFGDFQASGQHGVWLQGRAHATVVRDCYFESMTAGKNDIRLDGPNDNFAVVLEGNWHQGGPALGYNLDRAGNARVWGNAGVLTGTFAQVTANTDRAWFRGNLFTSAAVYIANAGSNTIIEGLQSGSLALSPSREIGVSQSGFVYQGPGVPNNANGNNGDAYFRTDTPGVANQRLYVKSAGAWVGIL